MAAKRSGRCISKPLWLSGQVHACKSARREFNSCSCASLFGVLFASQSVVYDKSPGRVAGECLLTKLVRNVHCHRFVTGGIATAIHKEKYRVSSDPRSQDLDGDVSTMVGDHMGIRRAVVLAAVATAFCTDNIDHWVIAQSERPHLLPAQTDTLLARSGTVLTVGHRRCGV